MITDNRLITEDDTLFLMENQYYSYNESFKIFKIQTVKSKTDLDAANSYIKSVKRMDPEFKIKHRNQILKSLLVLAISLVGIITVLPMGATAVVLTASNVTPVFIQCLNTITYIVSFVLSMGFTGASQYNSTISTLEEYVDICDNKINTAKDSKKKEKYKIIKDTCQKNINKIKNDSKKITEAGVDSIV